MRPSRPARADDPDYDATLQGEVQMTSKGVVFYPSVAPRGSGADWENARRFFDERTTTDWVALFDSDPSVMHHILGDIFREVRAQAESAAGKAKIGRRPKSIDGSFAELERAITPRYSHAPFATSLRELIGKESIRSFARRAGLTHPTVVRMSDGTMRLELYRLERLAKAGGVHPAYFAEWREHQVLAAISQVIQARPNLGIKLSKQIRALQAPASAPRTDLVSGMRA